MTDVRENIPHILEEHRKWWRGEGGCRANLAGAYLFGVNMAGADLAGAKHIIDGGQRVDGYRFVGWIKEGAVMIRAGCRSLTLAEYREHNSKRADAALRAETDAILSHIEAVAVERGLVSP